MVSFKLVLLFLLFLVRQVHSVRDGVLVSRFILHHGVQYILFDFGYGVFVCRIVHITFVIAVSCTHISIKLLGKIFFQYLGIAHHRDHLVLRPFSGSTETMEHAVSDASIATLIKTDAIFLNVFIAFSFFLENY